MGILEGLSRVSRASGNGSVALIIPLREYVTGSIGEQTPEYIPRFRHPTLSPSNYPSHGRPLKLLDESLRGVTRDDSATLHSRQLGHRGVWPR
jgi:hypothetical protein